jgi:putative DNA primase/helicase
MTGIHRTFLEKDGTPRFVSLGGNPEKRGMLGWKGPIRLSRNDAVSFGLGLCEGIEDGLALLLSGWAPVWAAGDKTGIKNFPLLSSIDCLTIFSDRGAGEAEAQACARRWREAGREALVVPPPGRAVNE